MGLAIHTSVTNIFEYAPPMCSQDEKNSGENINSHIYNIIFDL